MSEQAYPARAEHLLDVGGVRLYFSVMQGGAPTLLLEPGDGSDSQYWGLYPEVLWERTGATVVVYDRAGFGRSEPVRTPHSMSQEADWAVEGLQQLGLGEDLVLVGHSYGGWLVQLIAGRFPDAVRGLVLVESATTEYFRDPVAGAHHAERVKTPLREILDTPPEERTKWQTAFLRELEADVVERMRVMSDVEIPEDIPCCVITAGKPWLGETSDTWRRAHENLARRFRDSAFIVAEGAGHLVPSEDPDLVLQAIADVVVRVRSENCS